MSVSGLFSIGTSALQAAYAQIQTTGHNIANVDTPGYTRQRAELATASPLQTGGGFIGRGVDVVTVARLYDRFLVGQVRTGTAMAAADGARASLLGQLESLLGAQSASLGAALDDFRFALADLVDRPADGAARSVVLGRARALSERFGALSSGIEEIAGGVEARLADGVARVNGLLGEVAAVNAAIARSHASGQPPNDLLDRRDALVAAAGALLQVSVRDNPDGTVSLFGAGGHGLVVGAAVASLAVDEDPLDPQRSRIVLRTSGNDIPLSSGLMGAGELAGLLRFRDSDLAAARYALGRLAGSVAGAYNEAHALGVDATGAPGGDLFSIGAPQVAPARGNTGSASFSVGVSDPSALAASDYEITWDGSSHVITRLSDGWQAAVAAWPASVDGLRIDLGGGAPMPGDRFLVRSASAMASGFSAAIGSVQRLATGLAVAPVAGAANGGDVRAEGFAVLAAGPGLSAPVTISFDGAGAYSVSGAGTGNPTGLAYVPGAAISYNGWTLTLSGSPAAGDIITVQPVAEPAMDNRNARALLGLGDQGLVDGRSFTDAWAEMLADVGQRSRAAQGAAGLSAALLSEAKASLGAVSGVNLDEEAARLLQFQQSYQAAAKVIAAAQSMFDTLLGIAG